MWNAKNWMLCLRHLKWAFCVKIYILINEAIGVRFSLFNSLPKLSHTHTARVEEKRRWANCCVRCQCQQSNSSMQLSLKFIHSFPYARYEQIYNKYVTANFFFFHCGHSVILTFLFHFYFSSLLSQFIFFSFCVSTSLIHSAFSLSPPPAHLVSTYLVCKWIWKIVCGMLIQPLALLRYALRDRINSLLLLFSLARNIFFFSLLCFYLHSFFRSFFFSWLLSWFFRMFFFLLTII